MVIYKQNKNK